MAIEFDNNLTPSESDFLQVLRGTTDVDGKLESASSAGLYPVSDLIEKIITDISSDYLTQSDIYDGLDSTSTDVPLSANQGYKLDQAKADIEQENWIEPTLLNGWESFDTGRTPMYRINNFGKVEWKGALKPTSATSSTVCSIPTAYRPSVNRGFCCLDSVNSESLGATADAGGTLKISGNYSNAGIVYLDEISYYI